jgi:hypothetical protein
MGSAGADAQGDTRVNDKPLVIREPAWCFCAGCMVKRYEALEKSHAALEQELARAQAAIPTGTIIPKWGKVVKYGRVYWLVADGEVKAEIADAGMIEAIYRDTLNPET